MLLPLPALAAALAALGPPDVILPGSKGVSGQVIVGIAPEVRALAAVGHPIREGDTLRRLAERELGDVERWREILALNPDVEPDRLRVGTVLWLPPRARDTEAPLRLFAVTQLGHRTTPFVPGSPEFGDHYGGRVAAVREADVERFLALTARGDREELRQADWIGWSESMSKPRTMPASSRAERVVVEWSITAIEDGAPVVTRVAVRAFDAEGRRIERESTGGVAPLVFGGLVATGLLCLGLGFVARRRRTTAAVA